MNISLRSLKLFNYNIRHISKFRTFVVSFNSDKMEEFQNNPYFDRYREKLEKAKLSNPQEFEEKVQALKEQKRSDKLPLHPTDESSKQLSPPKCLNDVMNVELLKEKSTKEISELWTEYHKEKDCVFAVIPAKEYNDIKEKSKLFPNFILPVPRSGGYEFMLMKWVDDVCHFTSLDRYKKLNENAPTCLSLHHYPELSDDKDVVLMRGFPDLKSISVYESQLLALQIKLYYGLHSGLRFNLVRLFNNDPSSFRHMDLVVEFENYKKDSFDKKQFTFEGTPV